MKKLYFLLLLLLPLESYSQFAATLSRSSLINKDFASWHTGLGAEYGMKQGRANLSLNLNKISIDNLVSREYIEALPSLQTSTSFGTRWYQINGTETDIRLGFIWREPLGKVSLVAGLEGIVGRSHVYISEAALYYELTENGQNYKDSTGFGAVLGTPPSAYQTFYTHQEYLKLGFAPQMGFQYSMSPTLALDFLISSEFANRKLTTERQSFDGLPLQASQALNLHLNQILVQWKLSYTFLPKAKEPMLE